MKPLIGITSECRAHPDDDRTRGEIRLNWNYCEAISCAGGVPLIVPPTADPEAVAALIDGWLLPGGDDLDAALWGERNHPATRLQDPARFASEREIFRHLDPSAPILGICYGCQALNVLHGGTLKQHLPDEVGGEHHASGEEDEARLTPGTLLHRIAQADAVLGRSFHHQGVGRLGSGLRASARHRDGTIEAIESVERPWCVGVQWHPERSPTSGFTRRLFEAFIAAAHRWHREKSLRGVAP